MNAGMSARIVYVVSRAHSGSTLLDLLLSSHPGIVSVGEAKMFAQEPDKLCTCGAESWRACAFWCGVNERLTADGGSGVAVPEIESDDPAVFAAYNRRFFDAVAAEANVGVVLDSSKDLARLERFLASGLAVDVIHLIRHPCGVANSNMRKGGRLGRECRMYVREHLGAALALRGHRHTEVRYEDLAREPELELARLLRWLDLDPVDGQLSGWKTAERHNFGGNRMRFDSSDEIRLDEKWRTALTARQRLSILLRTLPVRLRGTPLAGLARRLAVRGG